jgi:hypothetical protein
MDEDRAQLRPPSYNPPFWDEVKCYAWHILPYSIPFVIALILLLVLL